MGLNARQIQPWELVDIDCQEAYRTVEETVRDPVTWKIVLVDQEDPENPGTNVKVPKKVVRYERRKHYCLKIRRKVVGITAYGEDVGQTQISFAFLTAPDIGLNYASTGKKWRCTRDAVPVEELVTGSAVQEQTWEYFAPWEEVDPKDFAGA